MLIHENWKNIMNLVHKAQYGDLGKVDVQSKKIKNHVTSISWMYESS